MPTPIQLKLPAFGKRGNFLEVLEEDIPVSISSQTELYFHLFQHAIALSRRDQVNDHMFDR